VTRKEALDRPWWLLPVGRIHPLWWFPVGIAMIWADYLLGPAWQFPALHTLPIIFAAWYSGMRPAVALGVAAPLFHTVFLLAAWQRSGDLSVLVALTMVRGTAMIALALWFHRLANHERQIHRYVDKLEGLLPICSFCKSIRNESEQWESLEEFISARSSADFSHGLCPSCLQTHYPAV
jgi:hypothetical protein